MKWLVLFLATVNIMIFAYFYMINSNKEPQHHNLGQLHPEKILILTPEQIEALPKISTDKDASKEAAPVQAQLPVCYEWGSFSGVNLNRAHEALKLLSLESSDIKQNPQESKRFWIYIPPKASMELAQEKVEELHNLGIQDSYVVQEPKWRFAISLGIFKDEQLANKLLEDLKNKGVKSALKGVRNQEKEQYSLLINGMTPDKVDQINKLMPEFTGSELKEVNCQS